MDHFDRTISFYGLLYIEEGERHVNLKGSDDPLLQYILCGALIQKSLEFFGHRFTLVTNNPKTISETIDAYGLNLNAIEIPFQTIVPPELNFRSAHRKIDLISACGRGEMGPRPGIIDLDMVMLRQLPELVVSSDCLVGYNIWNQVAPAYGTERIRDDVAQLIGEAARPLSKWWGGEFLLGPKKKFLELSKEIENIYPGYLQHARNLHHQGDEIIVTSALHVLSARSIEQGKPFIVDGGELGAIGRWWSARTLSPIDSLSSLADRSILHLPADKTILAELSESNMKLPEDIPMLLKALQRKTIFRRLLAPLNPITGLFSTSRKYAPRI